MYAHIAPLRKMPRDIEYFDYKIPEHLKEKIQPGHLVRIPFRKSHINGIVLNIAQSTPYKKVRDIEDILFETPLYSRASIELIQKASEMYMNAPSMLLKTITPEIPKKNLVNIPPAFSNNDITSLRTDQVTNVAIIDQKQNDQVMLYTTPQEHTAFLHRHIQKAKDEKKRILILFPTIESLRQFYLSLSEPRDDIAILHHDMGKHRYWEEYKKMISTASVTLTTRLGIFHAFDICILTDAESDDYKQSLQNPRFDARHLYALTSGIKIATSSTLSCSLFHKINSQNAALLVSKHNPHGIALIDMKNEQRGGNYTYFSQKLKQSVQETLQKGEKVVFYVPRKYAANVIICADCSHIFRCKNCQRALKQTKSGTGFCSFCQTNNTLPYQCPQCGGTNLRSRGMTTQSVATQVPEVFRINASIIEKDTPPDTDDAQALVVTPYFFEHYYHKYQDRIGLIAVLNADSLTGLKGFRSNEYAYQWLMRLQMYANGSKALYQIQTYDYENIMYHKLATSDWQSFYKEELSQRKTFNYPPFSALTLLQIKKANQYQAKKDADTVYETLSKQKLESIQVFEPKEYAREHGKYVYGIGIRSHHSQRKNIQNLIKQFVPQEWIIDIDPLTI